MKAEADSKCQSCIVLVHFINRLQKKKLVSQINRYIVTHINLIPKRLCNLRPLNLLSSSYQSTLRRPFIRCQHDGLQ